MNDSATADVRERLLQAALECFLADEFQNVTTRKIAEKAGANISMIRYYFGSKEGLYEEMIRDTLSPMLSAVQKTDLGSAAGIGGLLRLYYERMFKHPTFPKLILKVLALNAGPGKRFISQLLERARVDRDHRLQQLKAQTGIDLSNDAEVLHVAFVSLTLTPVLLRSVFEEQFEKELTPAFFERLAQFNALALSAALREIAPCTGPSDTAVDARIKNASRP